MTRASPVSTSGVWLAAACLATLFVAGCSSSRPSDAPSRTDSWRASPGAVAGWSEGEPAFTFSEADVPDYALPPVTAGADRAGWPARRDTLLALFRRHVYGRALPPPDRLAVIVLEDESALDGTARLRRLEVESEHQGRSHRFEVVVLTPSGRDGPVPAFLLLNHRAAALTDPALDAPSSFWPADQIVARGYAAVAVHTNALAPDDSVRFPDGVLEFLNQTDSGADRPGALAAWAWGASRALDALEDEPGIDASRVAVVGHSRGGKAALWAGAQDPRFALVVSNESGAGGAALSRRRYGETVARITKSFPHWFAPAFAGYGDLEDALPVDQHQLLALVAPRALYVASADEDLWADPRGEFLSLARASPAYALFGLEDVLPDAMPALDAAATWGPRGYHVRPGPHDLTPADWSRFMDFADTLWPRSF